MIIGQNTTHEMWLSANFYATQAHNRPKRLANGLLADYQNTGDQSRLSANNRPKSRPIIGQPALHPYRGVGGRAGAKKVADQW